MTVQEFYDWCKDRELTDAVMEISLKFVGLDMYAVEVKKDNIDYGLTGLPHKTEKYISLGGRNENGRSDKACRRKDVLWPGCLDKESPA